MQYEFCRKKQKAKQTHLLWISESHDVLTKEERKMTEQWKKGENNRRKKTSS